MCSGNIYPVPDPKFPFLGVHFTPRMNGDMWLGANAVLCTHREGYKISDFSLGDILDIARFPGIYKLVFKNIDAGINELWKALNVNAQIRDLQRFVPTLTKDDIWVGNKHSGVRAQERVYHILFRECFPKVMPSLRLRDRGFWLRFMVIS